MNYPQAVQHNGERCDVEYYFVDSFDVLADQKIEKAHAVCIWDHQLLVVKHSEWEVWGIPGGTREEGESIDQTLDREVLEEANCEIIKRQPIGYQKVLSSNGDFHYRLHYLCEVRPLSDFIEDPAGNINQIMWIDPLKYPEFLEKKEMRRVVLDRALEMLG